MFEPKSNLGGTVGRSQSAAVDEPTMTDMLRALVREVVREEMERTSADDDWLSLPDAARLASVHPETVARWIREKRLPSGKAGRVHRVRRADLHRFLAGPRRRERAPEMSPEELADKLYGED